MKKERKEGSSFYPVRPPFASKSKSLLEHPYIFLLESSPRVGVCNVCLEIKPGYRTLAWGVLTFSSWNPALMGFLQTLSRNQALGPDVLTSCLEIKLSRGVSSHFALAIELLRSRIQTLSRNRALAWGVLTSCLETELSRRASSHFPPAIELSRGPVCGGCVQMLSRNRALAWGL